MKHHSPRDNPFSACAVSTRGKIFRDEQMFICFARGEFPPGAENGGRHSGGHDGRKYRMLNVLDEFTHECLAIRLARKLKAVLSNLR
jgi:hypothetical protein